MQLFFHFMAVTLQTKLFNFLEELFIFNFIYRRWFYIIFGYKYIASHKVIN
jgi:hypothetical protein